MVAEIDERMAARELGVSGARIIAQPYLDGGRRIDAIAPAGSTIFEIVAIALPGAPEPFLPHVRVTIGETVIPREMWARVRPKPTTIVIVRIAPGNRGALRAALSIAVGVAALAIGQVWAAPLVGALGFGGSAFATGIAQSVLTGTTLLAGTFLINSLVPLRQNQAQGAGIAQSPTYSIEGFRNVANPDGVVPCVLGKLRFAPPYAALPYTEVSGGETYLRALFLVGYGQVKIRNIKLGDTPIENFKEIEVEIREGLPGDAPVTLYPTQVLEERLSIDLNQAYVTTYGPHTRFTASDAQEVQVDIAFPNGLFWMHTVVVGGTSTTYPLPLSVAIRIETRLNGTGSWSNVIDWSISAFTQKAASFSYRWTLPARGRYEIRVTRLTGDIDDLNAWQQNDQFVSVSLWSAIRSFRPEYPLNFNHPLALIAVRARASKQLNGVIDNLTCEASRVCLDWDSGTSSWIERETQNPASSLRYAMQGPMLAYPLADDEVDLTGLADHHEYCDAKGLAYNRVHDFEQSVFDAWSDISAAGRAAPRDDGEQWGVVIDRAQTVVMQHITARNSWGFSGQRDYVRFPDAFRVKFYDETNFGKQAERVIPWPGFVGDPVVTESIELPGITNPDQLWKEARRRQYELINRRDVYNATMDFEGACARRGDLILFNHDFLKRTQRSARVRAVNGAAVILDEIVTMETGKTYAIRFRKLPAAEGNDLSILRSVTTVIGEHDAVFVTGSGELPNVDDLVMFGESDSVTKEMVVREVEGAEDLARRFTLVDHAPQIETLADAEVPPPWNGRVGAPIEGYGARLDFSKTRNSQLHMLGWM
ncbi:MAG: host specificity factor TipJ family phage tail protein [Methylocystis sp.]